MISSQTVQNNQIFTNMIKTKKEIIKLQFGPFDTCFHGVHANHIDNDVCIHNVFQHLFV